MGWAPISHAKMPVTWFDQSARSHKRVEGRRKSDQFYLQFDVCIPNPGEKLLSADYLELCEQAVDNFYRIIKAKLDEYIYKGYL